MWTSSGGSRLKKRVKKSTREPAGRAGKIRKGKARALEWMNKFKYTAPAALGDDQDQENTGALSDDAATLRNSNNYGVDEDKVDQGAREALVNQDANVRVNTADTRVNGGRGPKAVFQNPPSAHTEIGQPQEPQYTLEDALAQREACQARVDGSWRRHQVGKLRPLVKTRLGAPDCEAAETNDLAGDRLGARPFARETMPEASYADNPQQATGRRNDGGGRPSKGLGGTSWQQARQQGAHHLGLGALDEDADDRPASPMEIVDEVSVAAGSRDVEKANLANDDTRVDDAHVHLESLFSLETNLHPLGLVVEHSPHRHERFFASYRDESEDEAPVLFFNNRHPVHVLASKSNMDEEDSGGNENEDQNGRTHDGTPAKPSEMQTDSERLARVLAVLRSGESAVFESALDVCELVDACVTPSVTAEPLAVQVLFTMAESPSVCWTPVALEYARTKIKQRFPGLMRLQSALDEIE
ncbi:Hypothetical Protein FCC1311_109322 [Hondaea fermentalgiana]|uniref:Uncharacterized protein n=1 Tax=Hondaea fermentalgiana TaxID=2315210 RepID=A0A2R5GV35_9STRA|nr:Hypothetical Protein FCC1311_109322 [Hondaea fermentalgiana]|eukprot:GBG34710.1 Hypothetical Protein FCC1311_109322 [Hondaea fermentalgiana]